MKKVADLKVPKGPRRGREIPLTGVADVSLRGLESPKEGEQKTFWSPSFSIDLKAFLFLICGDGRTRTAVQTPHRVAFYTLIRPLVFDCNLPEGGPDAAYRLGLGDTQPSRCRADRLK